jgi:hypothetical protein
VNRDATLSPALEGDMLEEVEASFLRCEISLPDFDPLVPADIPPVGTDGSTAVDYGARPSRRSPQKYGCCD